MNNSKKSQTIMLWSITVILTLFSVVYQKMTGPTYPVRGKIEIMGETIKYKLLRSHETTSDAIMDFAVPDTAISGIFKWRRYKSHDEWTVDDVRTLMNEINENFIPKVDIIIRKTIILFNNNTTISTATIIAKEKKVFTIGS
jgi:hypothetical protein